MIAFRIRRAGNRLEPTEPEGFELLRQLPESGVFLCTVRRPRSGPHNRKYWALCGLVASNHNELITKDMVSQVLKLETGHCDVVKVGDHHCKVPRSISFSAMDQTDFNDFYESALTVVVEKLLPGISRRAVEDEVLRMCDAKGGGRG